MVLAENNRTVMPGQAADTEPTRYWIPVCPMGKLTPWLFPIHRIRIASLDRTAPTDSHANSPRLSVAGLSMAGGSWF